MDLASLMNWIGRMSTGCLITLKLFIITICFSIILGLILTFLYTTSVGNRLLRILVSPAVSKAAGCVMNSRLSLIAVSGFIKSQNIDVSEFEKTSFSSYNDFFTRKLKPDARLLAQ